MIRGIFSLMMILFVGCSDSSSIDIEESRKLAEELFNHPEITEIDDCTRSRKYLNDIPISLERGDIRNEGYTTLKIKTPKYFREVLAEEGISEEDFEYFKNRLKDTELRHYYRKDNYSVFIRGGALGDFYGILVVHENDVIPQEGFRLNSHYYVWIGNELGKNVYWISG